MIDVVRMMAVYNEMDVLPANIDWYHRAGFRTVVVDNGSSDGSFEYCLEAQSGGKIDHVEQLITGDFDWVALLGRLHEVARALDPRWLMLTAPDEFFETASGEDLTGALNDDVEAGFNLIKFYNMEFWMTSLDDPSDPNPLTRLRHYSCYDVDMYRFYPNLPGLDPVKGLGHRPHFPASVKVQPSPRLYVSRHYKFRSLKQAQRKLGRVRPTEKRPGINTHYLAYVGPGDAIVPASRLHRYEFDHRWDFESVYDGKRNNPLVTRLPPG